MSKKRIRSPRQINSLRYFARNGFRLSDLKGAHQGTLGSLFEQKLLTRRGVTAEGLAAIEEYDTGDLSARVHPGELTERVANLLSVVRHKSRGASA